MEQMDLMQWQPPASRAKDPETCHEAATRAAPHASRDRLLVLLNLLVQPMTDFELAKAMNRQQTSAGKRRGELRDAGLVEVETDAHGAVVKRPAPSGAMSLSWRITAAGRDYYAEHSRAVA